MAQTNYEKAFERMPSEFLKYDQKRMIQRFHLAHDGSYLYLTMLTRRYRISRHTGTAEWTENNTVYFPAGILDSMVLYDLLCCAKDDCTLAGRFCRAENLPGAAYGADPAKGMFTDFAMRCDRAPDALARACRRLGGTDLRLGELGFRLPLFDFLPVIVQFWSSDEDFPPVFKLMWDENTLSFLHFETVCYAASFLVSLLGSYMETV